MTQLIVAAFVVALSGYAAYRAIRIVPQGQAYVVERLGRYHRTLMPGVNVVAPFADGVRTVVDLREQVVAFPPRPVATSDNLVVSADLVIYYQVTDPRAVTYEIAGFLSAVEQITVTTLREVVGGMDLDRALASRDEINSRLRVALDEVTGRWGVRVDRVELKSIDPPGFVQDAVEKEMRAEREKRASVLAAEAKKQSALLAAEGERQAAVLKARGEAEAAVLRAQADAEARAMRAKGQADAIAMVFHAIQERDPEQRSLAYRYLRDFPEPPGTDGGADLGGLFAARHEEGPAAR